MKKFNGDADGALCTRSTTVEIRWEKNAAGQFTPVGDAGEREARCPRSWCCWRWDSSVPSSRCCSDLETEVDARSNVQAEHGKYATSVKGVFAAGDCRRGQSLVVWAINEGRGAARECDRYLMGRSSLP